MRILILCAVLATTATAAFAGPPRGPRYRGVVTDPRSLRCGEWGMFVNPNIYVQTGPNEWAYRNGHPGTLSVGPRGQVTVKHGTRPSSQQSSGSHTSRSLTIENPYVKNSGGEGTAQQPQKERAKRHDSRDPYRAKLPNRLPHAGQATRGSARGTPQSKRTQSEAAPDGRRTIGR